MIFFSYLWIKISFIPHYIAKTKIKVYITVTLFLHESRETYNLDVISLSLFRGSFPNAQSCVKMYIILYSFPVYSTEESNISSHSCPGVQQTNRYEICLQKEKSGKGPLDTFQILVYQAYH